MSTLQYKIIKTDIQYKKYCDILELIEKYDEEHNSFDDLDPIQLLKGLMKEHKMKAVDLSNLLNVSDGLVSDILNYKKGLSKETIRVLADRFKLNQKAFNRPYSLKIATTKKELAFA